MFYDPGLRVAGPLHSCAAQLPGLGSQTKIHYWIVATSLPRGCLAVTASQIVKNYVAEGFSILDFSIIRYTHCTGFAGIHEMLYFPELLNI